MKPCCQDETNLETQHNVTPDLITKKCKVCGATHYAFTVDPIVVKLKVS